MERPALLRRIIDWLRSGYPNGVPQHDYVPLLALLRRQLTDEEVDRITDELAHEAPPPPNSISRVDAGVKITKVTDELPHETDIARVRDHLQSQGWPFDESPFAPDTADPDQPATHRPEDPEDGERS